MSIRYTIRHNIPDNLVEAEKQKWVAIQGGNANSSSLDFNLLRKHELAETVNHSLIYRTHNGQIINWDDLANERALEILSDLNDMKEEIESAADEAETKVENAIRQIDDALDQISNINESIDGIDDKIDTISEIYETVLTLPKDWAIKMNGKVVEDGVPVDYSSKYYAFQSSSSAEEAKDWATKTNGKVDGSEYSSKHYAN